MCHTFSEFRSTCVFLLLSYFLWKLEATCSLTVIYNSWLSYHMFTRITLIFIELHHFFSYMLMAGMQRCASHGGVIQWQFCSPDALTDKSVLQYLLVLPITLFLNFISLGSLIHLSILSSAVFLNILNILGQNNGEKEHLWTNVEWTDCFLRTGEYLK